MVVVNLAHELIAVDYLPFFKEQIKCTCISKKPWNMPLTAQFQRSLDYHTLFVYQEMRPSENVAFL